MLKRVSPSEAFELINAEGFQYLDVRTEAEWNAGHPAGAHNVPFMVSGPTGLVPNDDFLRVVKSLYAADHRLVLGCKAGGRSLKAAKLLLSEGFTDIVDQRAGWDGLRDNFGRVTEPGWTAAGLPSEEATLGASYQELKSRSSG
jgi:rhodanese-related sulfurtransferase